MLKLIISFIYRLLPAPFYKIPSESELIQRRDKRVRQIVGPIFTARDREKAYNSIKGAVF